MAISFDYLPSAVNDRANIKSISAQLVKLKCRIYKGLSFVNGDS